MATCPLPTPTSRWVGYLSYDLGRLFEELPCIAADDLHMPLFCFSLMEQKTGDQKTGSGVVSTPSRHDASVVLHPEQVNSSLPKARFIECVSRALQFIRNGDIFQVNLSHRLTLPLTLGADQIWQNLLEHTPAAYGAFLDLGDHSLVANSPELFLHVSRDRTIITRPIKGTRPRQPGMETALVFSPKDQAELNMIIDLERNDLGRICRIGSVKVTQPRTIETHPTVYHGVATVQGKLMQDITFIDLLRATFPGGSITGAPKIRAMQIIEELEPVRRGPYCGAIGYLAADGSMQFNIAIRTLILRDNQAHLQVGGGIVADSIPLEEYEETLTKAAALLQALHH